MSARPMMWRHVTINTRGSWLHGDPRGFRSKKHRIHSSGDYRNPPPKGEHEGLYRYHKRHSREEVRIPFSLRPVIGRAIIKTLRELGFRVILVAVGKVHAHAVVELPNDIRRIRVIIGHAKRKSSRAVKKALPGSVWSSGGTFKPAPERKHLLRLHSYLLFEQGPGAWTWCFRDGSDDGCFTRERIRRSRDS